MPVYRAIPSYLEASVKSILGQTHDELELVIVMDPSDAESDSRLLSVLDQFKDDHRLNLRVNRGRLGVTRSLNVAITMCQGELIGRMDGDDLSSENRISEQIEWMEQTGAGICGCWCNVIDEMGRRMGRLKAPSSWTEMRRDLFKHNPFVHSSILFRREVLSRIGCYRPEFEPSEDYEFYLRVFSSGFTGTNVPRFLHSLREHPSSVTQGSKWFIDRVEYTKSKLFALSRFPGAGPRDIIYAMATPASLFLTPNNVLKVKKMIGWYKPDGE